MDRKADENLVDIEQKVKEIQVDSLVTMTYGGAILDKLENFSVQDLASFCSEKLKLKNLVWDMLAEMIVNHYVNEHRYKREEK